VIVAEDTGRLRRNLAEPSPRLAELSDLGLHVVQQRYANRGSSCSTRIHARHRRKRIFAGNRIANRELVETRRRGFCLELLASLIFQGGRRCTEYSPEGSPHSFRVAETAGSRHLLNGSAVAIKCAARRLRA
jgi:hypothetical protein